MAVGIILKVLEHMRRPILVLSGAIPWPGDFELHERESELAHIYTSVSCLWESCDRPLQTPAALTVSPP